MDYRNIFHVVHFSSEIKPVEWGFPPEFTTCLNPVYTVNPVIKAVQHKKMPRICFILDDEKNDPGFRISRKVLHVFNNLRGFESVIVLPRTIPAFLPYLANEHVLITTGDTDLEKQLERCDLLLASGEIAIKALLNRIPVIIVGLKGVGGLVNNENVMQFVRSGFNGRIGGTMYEDIPVQLIQFEIDSYFNDRMKGASDEWPSLSDKMVANLKSAYVDNDNEHTVNELLRRTQKWYSSLMNDQMVEDLKPAICSHIRIEKNENGSTYAAINLFTGKNLFTIDEAAMRIGAAFDGSNTIRNIAARVPDTAPAAIIDLVRNAWEKKVLYFN